MKVCSYVVKSDCGLAPNPFWGYCTLALSTPNHQGIRLFKEDWIIGTTFRSKGAKLIYAMKILDKLHFDEYFRDHRFQDKIPNLQGNWQEKCGDNIYFLDDDGFWQQLPNSYRTSKQEIRQDLKYPYVYVAEEFYYLGEKAVHLPTEFRQVVVNQLDSADVREDQLANQIVDWIQKNLQPGIYGFPSERKEEKDHFPSEINFSQNRHSMTPKDVAIRTLEKLPDEATWSEISKKIELASRVWSELIKDDDNLNPDLPK